MSFGEARMFGAICVGCCIILIFKRSIWDFFSWCDDKINDVSIACPCEQDSRLGRFLKVFTIVGSVVLVGLLIWIIHLMNIVYS